MLLERTPPKRRTPAPGASVSPGKLSTPTRQAAQPQTPGSVTRSQTRQQRNSAQPAAPTTTTTEWPSLESMAEPVRERRAQATLVRSSASKPPPGSASRNGIVASASKVFQRPNGVGHADVPSSLPRPPPSRPGTLYPTVAALQKQAGNGSGSLVASGRSSLTGLDGARARAGDETPKAVSDAKQQQQQQHQLISRPPIAAALEKRMASEAQREADVEASLELAKSVEVTPSATTEATLASSTSMTTSNDAQDEYARRMEAALADPRAAFQDRRRQDMRKSISAPAGGAQEEPTSVEAGGPSADEPKSSYALQVEAALAQGPEFNPFGTAKRSTLHDDRPLPTPREADPAPVMSSSFRASQTRRAEASTSVAPVVTSSTSQLAALRDEAESTPRAAPPTERALNAQQTFSPRARPIGSPLKESLLSPSKLSSPHRLDPLTRNERVQALEIESLRKKAAELNKDLAQASKRIQKAQDDAEGWKAECEGLEGERETLLTQAAALERRFMAERSKKENWELKCMELRCESDRRQWEALTGPCSKEALRDANTELVICRNEVTYQTYRGHELQHALDMAVEQAAALKRKMRLRLDDANAKLETSVEECETLRAAVEREKERRKEVAREAMKVEAHRDELLDQIEALEQAGSRNAKGADPAELRAAKAKAESLEKELRRAERKAEAEEERRRVLEQELQALKSQITSKAGSTTTNSAASRKRKATPELDEFEADEPAPPVSPARPAAPAPARRGRPPKQRPVEPEPEMVEPEEEAGLDFEPEPAPARSRPVATASKSKAKAKVKAKSKPVYRGGFDDDEAQEEDEEEEDEQEQEAADVYRAVPTTKRAKNKAAGATLATSSATTTSSKSKASAPVKQGRSAPPPVALDITATPIVRKVTKSVLSGASSKANALSTSSATLEAPGAAGAGGIEKKKKRKLLGGGAGGIGGKGAKAPGFFHFGNNGDEASLNPTLNIPTELSPVKQPNRHAMRPAGSMFGR